MAKLESIEITQNLDNNPLPDTLHEIPSEALKKIEINTNKIS